MTEVSTNLHRQLQAIFDDVLAAPALYLEPHRHQPRDAKVGAVPLCNTVDPSYLFCAALNQGVVIGLDRGFEGTRVALARFRLWAPSTLSP